MTFQHSDLTVVYHFIPGCRGHCDRYGAPEEPDELAYCEIDSVKDATGKEVMEDLAQGDFDALCVAAEEHYSDYCSQTSEPDYDEPPGIF